LTVVYTATPTPTIVASVPTKAPEGVAYVASVTNGTAVYPIQPAAFTGAASANKVGSLVVGAVGVIVAMAL